MRPDTGAENDRDTGFVKRSQVDAGYRLDR
jgi:hypothetical protein